MPRAGEKNKTWAGRVRKWVLLHQLCDPFLFRHSMFLHLTAKKSGVKLRNCVLVHVGPVRDSASVAAATSKQGMGETIEAMIVKVDFLLGLRTSI